LTLCTIKLLVLTRLLIRTVAGNTVTTVDATIAARRQATDMTTIYGIKNCDTMKRAFAWLKDHGVDYEFRHPKSAGKSY
jgi:hypothetical protein